MLKNWLMNQRKKDNEEIVKAIVEQTSSILNNMNNQMNLRFQELSSQVKELELSLLDLEKKLLLKDLKDKQTYGMLHYKIHEKTTPKD
jgi:hypothetical protein